MARQLDTFGTSATLRFRLEGDAPAVTRDVVVSKGGAHVAETPSPGLPSLEIVTTHAIWRAIAGGTLSPLEAFVTRKMRVLGSTGLGVKVFRHLRGSGRRVDIC
jgi:putative sterol carrier protein